MFEIAAVVAANIVDIDAGTGDDDDDDDELNMMLIH